MPPFVLASILYYKEKFIIDRYVQRTSKEVTLELARIAAERVDAACFQELLINEENIEAFNKIHKTLTDFLQVRSVTEENSGDDTRYFTKCKANGRSAWKI